MNNIRKDEQSLAEATDHQYAGSGQVCAALRFAIGFRTCFLREQEQESLKMTFAGLDGVMIWLSWQKNKRRRSASGERQHACLGFEHGGSPARQLSSQVVGEKSIKIATGQDCDAACCF